MSTRHAQLLQALMRKASEIERRIRIVILHEEGLDAGIIAARIGTTRRFVEKSLKELELKRNPLDKSYLRNDRRFGKAAER